MIPCEPQAIKRKEEELNKKFVDSLKEKKLRIERGVKRVGGNEDSVGVPEKVKRTNNPMLTEGEKRKKLAVEDDQYKMKRRKVDKFESSVDEGDSEKEHMESQGSIGNSSRQKEGKKIEEESNLDRMVCCDTVDGINSTNSDESIDKKRRFRGVTAWRSILPPIREEESMNGGKRNKGATRKTTKDKRRERMRISETTSSSKTGESPLRKWLVRE